MQCSHKYKKNEGINSGLFASVFETNCRAFKITLMCLRVIDHVTKESSLHNLKSNVRNILKTQQFQDKISSD